MFIFRIYDLPAGGALQWSEGPLPIATTGGLFTHQLGSGALLPVTLFEDFDSLYLEVEADGAIITPRTRLTPGPYTKVAGGLDGRSAINPDSTYIKTDPGSHALVTYGADGGEQTRLWGPSWGQLQLFDSDPTNDLEMVVSGDDGSGAGPFIQAFGNSPWYLWSGPTGDGTAVLPTDAINAGEMLNEPGIAHSFRFGSTTLTGLVAAIESVSIDYPTSGFAVITATGYFYFTPFVTGTVFGARAYINTVPGVGDFDNFAIETIESSLPSYAGDQGYRTFSLTKVEAVGPGTAKYYLNADRFGGAGGSAVSIHRVHLTAQFFPTNYGTVVSTKPVVPRISGNVSASADVAGTSQPSEVQVITVEDSKARLEAEHTKQLADMAARLKKLEEAAKTGKQQVVDDNR
jgi:hypothetical protein